MLRLGFISESERTFLARAGDLAKEICQASSPLDNPSMSLSLSSTVCSLPALPARSSKKVGPTRARAPTAGVDKVAPDTVAYDRDLGTLLSQEVDVRSEPPALTAIRLRDALC